MEILRDTNFDFLGKKWPFIILSLVLTAVGLISLWVKGGPRYGIDFKGGSLIRLKFNEPPRIDQIRATVSKVVPGGVNVQNFTDPASRNEVIIGTELTDERSLDTSQRAILEALESRFGKNAFTVRSREVVGPKVGADLRNQAIKATLYALAGMLVYIAFRFEWIYGAAAVIAVFHDTIITIGLFSVFNEEISLTVIAALLTLVGYSMNDTIVIFDRIRENLKILRREPLESLMNKSVNQTLSRTVLTSGLTFLTCISLFLFGGAVLHGFAFALVCGILVGTYSSVFIASPIVLFWQNYKEGRKRTQPPPAPAVKPAPARPAAKKTSSKVTR